MTANTTVTVTNALALGKIEITGSGTLQIRLENGGRLSFENTGTLPNCRVNLASIGAKLSVPKGLGLDKIVSAIFPGNVRVDNTTDRNVFWLNASATPERAIIAYGETAEEAMETVGVYIPDQEARFAGQAGLLKKEAVENTTYGANLWEVSLALDETKMQEGQKIDDTLAVFATNLTSLAGATETSKVTIPVVAATSGLYYSLLISPNLDFAHSEETPRVIADGRNDLALVGCVSEIRL